MRACPFKHPGAEAVWQRARAWVLERDGHRCTCGAPATQVDHIWPRARGGSDAPENLRAMCRPCNQDKRAELPVGMLPLFVVAERNWWGGPLSNPGDRALAKLAAQRHEEWARVATRMVYGDLKPSSKEDHDIGHCRRLDRAMERCGYWRDVERWHLNRGEVEARGLTWALALPRVTWRR